MTEGSKERYVLDTNQIIGAGTAWLTQQPPAPTGANARLLSYVAMHQQGLYCGKIIGEYLEKLIDLGHDPERTKVLIAYILGAFQRIALVTKSAPFPPSDVDDEVFLLCAIDGQAHFVVTEDKHLLAVSGQYSAFKIGTLKTLGLNQRLGLPMM